MNQAFECSVPMPMCAADNKALSQALQRLETEPSTTGRNYMEEISVQKGIEKV